MKKVIKEFPKVELKSYEDKKEELNDFFASIEHELADYEHLDLIKSKKVDFLNWLQLKRLNRLLINFNLVEPITEFEWQCRQDILAYVRKFDLYMLQCIKNKEELEYSEIHLRRKMSEFDRDYEDLLEG